MTTTTTADQTGTTGQTGTTNNAKFAGAKDQFTQATDKARAFAKARPGATAALAGVVGLALLNTLRGR
ncbi:MAG TPA: hypothetical protein VF592_10980 [Sphingomonas sp.]|jgi:hypothetical protein|uniref:hypothetical protein n=1 Tax=Sphingomonas sp. TaxID=28214 RepID=UPI002EDAFA72